MVGGTLVFTCALTAYITPAVLGGAIVLLVHGFYAAKVSEQVSRNDFLKKETEKLDKDIAELIRMAQEFHTRFNGKLSAMLGESITALCERGCW